jgi:hypothetical protein
MGIELKKRWACAHRNSKPITKERLIGSFIVIPAKAGIRSIQAWIPAFAGMTE